MNIRLFALALALVLFAPPLVAQESQGLRIDLNLPALKVVVYDGDKVIRSYPVAVGKPGHDTPTGEFLMDHAEWNPWWRPPPGREWTRGKEITPPGPTNPMGRVKLFFAPLYFIHGTPEAESIGTPASHGCVRMRNADVVELARLIHERATNVSGKEIDRILAASRTTRRVNFQKPIPVVIRYEPVVVEDGVLRVYPDLYKRNWVHTESIYQALMGAGYSIREVERDAVVAVLDRAKRAKGTFSAPVADLFPRIKAAAATN